MRTGWPPTESHNAGIVGRSLSVCVALREGQGAEVNRRFSMPSCLILDSSVEAGRPSLAAAPRGRTARMRSVTAASRRNSG